MLSDEDVDGIDRALRAKYDAAKPLGGIRLLAFGDFFQVRAWESPKTNPTPMLRSSDLLSSNIRF